MINTSLYNIFINTKDLTNDKCIEWCKKQNFQYKIPDTAKYITKGKEKLIFKDNDIIYKIFYDKTWLNLKQLIYTEYLKTLYIYEYQIEFIGITLDNNLIISLQYIKPILVFNNKIKLQVLSLLKNNNFNILSSLIVPSSSISSNKKIIDIYKSINIKKYLYNKEIFINESSILNNLNKYINDLYIHDNNYVVIHNILTTNNNVLTNITMKNNTLFIYDFTIYINLLYHSIIFK